MLIEPKAAFVHNVATVRAVIDPAWLDKLILPYDHLLKRGRVLRDRVIAIESDGVRLAANGSPEGDMPIVATGSKYAQPFKASGDSISDFRAALLAAHERLKAARSVAIVSGCRGRRTCGRNRDANVRQTHRSRFRDSDAFSRFYVCAGSAA